MQGNRSAVEVAAKAKAAAWRVKFAYLSPDFANPTGETLTLSERNAVLDLAEALDIALVEDAAYQVLRHDGAPVPPLLALSLALQTALLLVWLAVFDRKALAASFGVWRVSLLAGFLGAFASEFWFLGFSMTAAANVRTLALVEVILATAMSRFWLGQNVSHRQLWGMAVVVVGVVALLRLDLGQFIAGNGPI